MDLEGGGGGQAKAGEREAPVEVAGEQVLTQDRRAPGAPEPGQQLARSLSSELASSQAQAQAQTQTQD